MKLRRFLLRQKLRGLHKDRDGLDFSCPPSYLTLCGAGIIELLLYVAADGDDDVLGGYGSHVSYAVHCAERHIDHVSRASLLGDVVVVEHYLSLAYYDQFGVMNGV